MISDNYGHTTYKKMFYQGDVYGVGYDEERAAKKPVRLGMIGFGGVSLSKHIPAIARLKAIWEPVTLTAVCCRDARSGKRATDIYGVKWYGDAQEMLDSEPLDGVIICSPDSLHCEHTLLALEHGVHVLVEKPLATSLREAQRMVKTAEAAREILMTVSNKRYSPPYFRAKQMLTDGTLPNPAMLAAKFNLGYEYVNVLEGGTVHVLDLTRYLMGDVKSVSAIGIRKYDFNKTSYPFDNAVSLLEFESGAVGTVYTSASALSLKPWEMVEIYGEKRWLRVDDQYELTLYDDEEGPAKSWKPVIPNTLLFDEEFGGFMGLIENFCDAIRGIATPIVTGEDGYRALELVYAFHMAAASGKKISLPIDPEIADAEINKIFRRSKLHESK